MASSLLPCPLVEEMRFINSYIASSPSPSSSVSIFKQRTVSSQIKKPVKHNNCAFGLYHSRFFYSGLTLRTSSQFHAAVNGGNGEMESLSSSSSSSAFSTSAIAVHFDDEVSKSEVVKVEEDVGIEDEKEEGYDKPGLGDPIVVPLPSCGPLVPPKWVLNAVREQPWKGGLEPCGEQSYTVDQSEIEGSLPPELRGTLYRCGPGRIRIGEKKYSHWFDGDGMVYALHIGIEEGAGDGEEGVRRIQFESRWVKTEMFREREKRAEGESEIRAKGAWTRATTLLGNFGLPGNPANTSVVKFGGRVMALCEGGSPVEVDACSLETKETNADGSVRRGGSIDFGLPCFFSAHPSIDPVSGEMYNHGLVNGRDPSQGLASFIPFAISPAGDVRQGPSINLGALTFVHDSAISANFFIFAISPYSVDSSVALLALVGLTEIGNELKYDEKAGTQLIIVNKQSLRAVKRMTVEAFSTYHFCNAFEHDGHLHVLVNRLDGPRDSLEDMFKDMYKGTFHRHNYNSLHEFVWEIATWQLTSSRPAIQHPSATPSLGMEFPQINPLFIGRQNRFVYTHASAPVAVPVLSPDYKDPGEGGLPKFAYFNRIQKYDLEAQTVATHVLPEGEYVSEGSFIARKDGGEEDDGYFVVFLYESRRHASSVVVLDAKNIEAPPVARLHLRTHVPYYFHGCWAPV